MKKRILSLLLIVAMLAGLLSGCAGGKAQEIYTPEDLLNMAKRPGGNYILMADIDMTGQVYTPIKTFSGTFDGNGKSISNLTITTTPKNASDMGFFGEIAKGGKVCDLRLENIGIYASGTNAEHIGTFAGTCKGSIDNCSVTGLINNERTDVDGKPIYVGVMAGYAASTATIIGGETVSFTDPVGVFVTGGLCANVNLFVNDCDTVFHGFVGHADDGATLEGQWRDSFYGSLRISETLRARQQKVVDYMYKMGTVAWTVPSVMTHKGSSEIHNQTFMPGETYYGIPYDHTAGSYERFMFCMDENNQVLSWVAEDLSESKWSSSDPSLLGFTLYMGNDCSSAVAWSWMQVSANVVGKTENGEYQGGAYVLLTDNMIPNWKNQDTYGIYPVGSWTGEDFDNATAVYQTGELRKCSEIVAANGEETIYEAYARARKADALVFGEPGGHARLLAEDPVVIRNADNTVDPMNSYVLCHEQGDGLYNNRYEGTNSSWRINYRYTFDVLLHGSNALDRQQKHLEAGSGAGYLPITIRALRQESHPDAFVEVSMFSGELRPDCGEFYSNFRIVSTTVVIRDSNGNKVYNKEIFSGSDGTYDSLRGENTTVKLQDTHGDSAANLSPGTYTFTVKILLSDGSTHTVVDNQTFQNP